MRLCPIIAASIAAPSRKVEGKNSKIDLGYQFIFELFSIISNRVLRSPLAQYPL
jgi:hypothetical protein